MGQSMCCNSICLCFSNDYSITSNTVTLFRKAAESILNTTTGVLDALEKAKKAQEKASSAIEQAESDIDTAQEDLKTVIV